VYRSHLDGRPDANYKSVTGDLIPGLPAVQELAVIINVETKYVTSLALLSTLRHIDIPVLVIDCESKDGSFDWFASLQRHHAFHLISAPRRPHGMALDWIFQTARADCILLVDSDVEVLNKEMFEVMRARLSDECVYGAGYLQPGEWFKTHYGTNQRAKSGIGFYMTRPWIPFALLRVGPIRQGVAAGASFMHLLVLNDLPQIPAIGRLLWHRFRIPGLRQMRLRPLDYFRHEYEERKPSYVFFDTGAQIHQVLTRGGFSFGDVGPDIPYWSVRHLQGVTRSLLYGASHDAQSTSAVEPIVLEKLKEYGI
jgi:hypothetical protein